MALNLTLRSPGFYAREVEIFPNAVVPQGLGAGGVGTAELGPAFVPVTVNSVNSLSIIFGNVEAQHQGVLAGREYLNQGGATYTYMRVLGAGTAPRVVFNAPNAYLSHTPNAGFVAGFDDFTSEAVDDDWLEGNVSQMSATYDSQTLFAAANEDANIYFLGGFFTDSDLANTLSTVSSVQPQTNNITPLLESAGNPAQYSPVFTGSLVTAGAVALTNVTGTTIVYSTPVEDPHVVAASTVDGRPVSVTAVASGTSSVTIGIAFDSGAASTANVIYSIFDRSGSLPQITGSNLVRGVVFAKNGFTPVVSSSLGYSAFGEIYDADGGALNTSAAASANYDESRFQFAVLSGTRRGLDGFYRPSGAEVVFGPSLVSFNPNENAYFSNVLNTDPGSFSTKGHLLYSHWDVLDSQVSLTGTIPGTLDLASDPDGTSAYSVEFSGSTGGSALSGTLTSKFPRYTPVFCVAPTTNFNRKWHNYIDRFKTAASPMVISQAIGGFEYDLFKVHSRHDGVNGNTVFKISISNIKYPTTDLANVYPTFALSVRQFGDTDKKPVVLESFNDLTLNPASDRYIARVIGSSRTFLDLDQVDEEDRKITQLGDYENRSNLIWIEPTDELEKGNIPSEAIPFGYSGIEVLNLSSGFDLETSAMNTVVTSSAGQPDGVAFSGTNIFLSTYQTGLTFSGTVEGSYRGVFAATGSGNTAALGVNASQWIPVDSSTVFNVSSSFTASQPFQAFGNMSGTVNTLNGDYFSITKQFDVSTPMSGAVVPPPYRLSITRGSVNSAVGVQRDLSLSWGFQTEEVDLTSPKSMQDPNASQNANGGLPSYFLFFGVPETGNILSGTAADIHENNKFTLSNVELGSDRGTSLSQLSTLNISDAVKFRYKRNGVSTGTGSLGDIVSLDRKNRAAIWNRLNSVAKFTFPVRGGFDGVNVQNFDRERLNNAAVKAGALTGSVGESQEVFVYNEAARVMLDKTNTDIEIFAIPGITEPLVTDSTIEKTENYFDAVYIMDLDQSNSTTVRDVVSVFEARSLDSNFAATYFPNVRVLDSNTGRNFEVSPSPVVLGALALNDRLGQPWFAPAGLSRGALQNVTAATFRLKQDDRDILYDASINPIVSFPGQGYVVFGQKTLDQSESALNRLNIRRLMIRTRRVVKELSGDILFDQYTQSAVDQFRLTVEAALREIQRLSGIRRFRVELSPNFKTNQLDGKITIEPISAIEFVTIDFIVDKSGVTFG